MFAQCELAGLAGHVLAKPSPALDAGDRVVVVTGESKGLTGTIERVRDVRIANQWVSMARVVAWVPSKGKTVVPPKRETFDVGLAQLKRHGLDLYYNFQIHDRVRVVSGGLYVGATGRVEQIDGHFLTITVPDKREVVCATFPSTMSMGAKIFIISMVHDTRQWAIGDSVRVTRGEKGGRRGVILHLHHDGFLELFDVCFLACTCYFSH